MCTSQNCLPETTSTIETQANIDSIDIENIPPVLDTPTATRFKDVLLSKSPSTPRHRVKLAGLSLTPRSSQGPKSVSRTQSAFAAARQLFTQSSSPTKLSGRDAERQQLRHFVLNATESRTGGCTYVSGPPGTGKSALVREVFQEFENSDNIQTSMINCVSLRTAVEVYGKLIQDFSPNTTVGKTGLKQHLSNLFLDKSAKKMHLVLLDEIDNLLDADCDMLYTIFEWAMHKSSTMILVGIANALDLTDRFLPRLKKRGLKPRLLPFLPYTAAQITTIISDKLRSLLPGDTSVSQDFIPFMQPAAVQLCGKKIASQTGDLRKAFSLAQRIIDHLERETNSKQALQSPTKAPLGELQNIASPPQTPSSTMSRSKDDRIPPFTAETAPRATIAHAAKIASSIFNIGTTSRLNGLNLQQKAVLCSLITKERRKFERNPFVTPSKSSSKTPTIKDLFMKYCALCKRDEGLLQPLKDTEFRDVVASLETLGLVHEQKGRTSSLLTPTSTPSRKSYLNDDKQVVSAVSEKELRESLSGAGADLLHRLLDES